MRQLIGSAFAAALIAAGAATAQADWIHDKAKDGYHSVKRDFYRNNAWPEPFIWPDRQATLAPFGVMIHNGWRMQNTLGPYHFREGTNELTEAGQLKVMWILTEAPAQHRTIFVERGQTAEATARRIRTVQNTVVRLAPEAPPAVFETIIPARGWPADQVDATNRQYLNTVPSPRLPAATGGGSGSSGSSN